MARLRRAQRRVSCRRARSFWTDEEGRLAAAARDPAFREAVASQSRESLFHAVAKLAADTPGSASPRRRSLDVVGT